MSQLTQNGNTNWNTIFFSPLFTHREVKGFLLEVLEDRKWMFLWEFNWRWWGNDVRFSIKKKKSFQMQVKLPSLLLQVHAFWPTGIKGALFPVTPWRMKVMWKQPIFLCHPAILEAYPLLFLHSLLGLLTPCHSQVHYETLKLHAISHEAVPLFSSNLVTSSHSKN